MKLSFVIPVYNEKETVLDLYHGIQQEMTGLSVDYEVIFVDDGSDDGSFSTLEAMSEKYSEVKIVKLRRNFGKSVALDEGFKRAAGEIIFTMDSDLQDDPKEIPKFLQKIDEGYDLVSGWKQKRKDPVLGKNIPSKLFNFTIGLASGLKIHDYNCGFKAYRKRVINDLSLYGDLHRFIPAIVHSKGYSVTEVEVRHRARDHGKTKFGMERFFHGMFDFLTVIFLTKFLKRPMHFFGWLGTISFLLGGTICLYLAICWFSGQAIGQRPLLTLGVLLILVGMQLVSTGLVAEILTHDREKKQGEEHVEYTVNLQ